MSGAATLSIPVAVPPGPGGLAPQLALVYSSQAGNGPFGIGWRLPLGEIRCSARFGVPDYASCEQYELDGQLLVEGAGRYHTLVESFQHIVKDPAGYPNSWKVTQTDGTVLRYGIDDNGRIHADTSIARWLLQQIEDTHGNQIDIAYDLDEDAEPGTAYPSVITYAGGFRKVEFFYEGRPDELHDFSGGIERFVTKRLREIQVTSSGAVFQRRLFGYAAPTDYTTVRSRLAWTQVFGTDCDDPDPVARCTGLPRQEYDYTDSTAGHVDEPPGSPWELPVPLYLPPDAGVDQNVSDPGVRFADVNGDGLTDIVHAYCTDGEWPCANESEGDRQVYLNTGSGWDTTSDEAVAWTASLRSLTYDQPSVQVQTDAYDHPCGYSDVTTVTRGVVFSEWAYYFLPVPGVQLDRTYRPLLSWQLADLNGDGLPDLVTSEAFGGIARRVSYCGIDPAPGEAFLTVPNEGGEVRAAFRNTGSGWERDDSLAEGLPLFSSIMADAREGSGWDCRDGNPQGIDMGGYEYGTYSYEPPCMARLRFHPVFVELDGDPEPELIALQPDDPETPWMHVTAYDYHVYAPNYENDYSSLAWDYRETRGWQRAQEFDPPTTHIYTAYGAWDPYDDPQGVGGGQTDTDLGARFADLNRDGLADLIKRNNAWLNRGAGENPSSAWVSDSRYASPNPYAATEYGFDLNCVLGGGDATYYCACEEDLSACEPWLEKTALKYVGDLNGDGWVDLQIGYSVWLNSGAAIGESAWLSVPGFAAGVEEIVDVNGDGVADAVYAIAPKVLSVSLSQPSFPDLIQQHRNGRGGTLEFAYESAVAQRDDEPGGLEQAAYDHALRVGEDGVGSPDWKRVPVVTSVTTSGLNRTDEISTYAYADPRWDETLRTGLGFRLVEQTRPDGSVSETYFYQALGRAGRVSEQTVWDAGGPLSHSTQDWEIASGPSCPGCPVIGGSIADVYVGRLTETTSRNEYGATVGAVSGPARTRTFTYDDSYGYNFVNSIFNTTPNHDDFLTIRNPFPADTSAWIIGLLGEERVEEIGGPVHARSLFSYWPSGRLMIRTQDTGARDEPVGTSTVTTQWFYDANGNVIQLRNPKGRDTYFCYDGDTQFADGATTCPQFTGQTSHSVRVGLRDARGKVISFEPELASGRIVQRLAPDYADVPGAKAVLDAFGRAVEEYVIDASDLYSLVRETEYYDFGEPGGLAVPYVETFSHVDTTVSSCRDTPTSPKCIRTAVYDDGFGGTWRTVEEVRESDAVRYRGTATYIDSSNNTRWETYPLACVDYGGDEHCSTLMGNTEGPAVVTTTDALGRVLRIETPHEVGNPGIALRSYFTETRNGLDYDGVLIENAKGDLRQHLGHQGKVVWIDECGTSCGTADQTWYVYEPTGELWTVYDPMAASSGYTDPAHYLRYEHDRLGRITKIEDPDGGVSESGYDETGNLISHTNARHQEVTYQYVDLLDRPTGITTPAGEDDVTFDYTDGFLQRTGVTATSFSKIFSYDDLGRLETQQLIARFDRTFLLDFQYDLLGRQTQITYPGSDTVIRYEYEGAYLKRVCDLNGEITCSNENKVTAYISDVEYDDFGRRTAMHTLAGVRSFSYDATSYRLAQDRFDSSGTYWMEKVYTQYDELGNIEVITGGSSAGDIDLSSVYTYDARNRLKTWSRSGGAVSETYDYDALGNLTLKGDTGNPQTNTYDPDDRPHAIRSRTVGSETTYYFYDDDGNVRETSDPSGSVYYSYGSRGRMTCAGSSAGACDQLTVYYDEEGQRISEVANGSLQTHFVGDLFRWTLGGLTRSEIFAFGEHIGSKLESKMTLRAPASTPFALFGPLGPPLLAILLLGGGLCLVWWSAELGIPQMIAQHPSTATLSLALAVLLTLPQGALAMRGSGNENVVTEVAVVANHLDSDVLFLNQLGARLSNVEYDPFGGIDQQVIAGVSDVRFAGHRRESVTGLYYMKARWYDPAAGRFRSVDPVVGNKNDPQSHNPYSYVENNPVNFTDPTGMCRVCGVYGFTYTKATLNLVTMSITLGSPASSSDFSGVSRYQGSTRSGSNAFGGIENITITSTRGGGSYTITGGRLGQRSQRRLGAVGAGVGAGPRQGQVTAGEQLWNSDASRSAIESGLLASAEAVRNADSYRMNMEQGVFVYENPDKTFSYTEPDQYAPFGEHMKGTGFGPGIPLQLPRGTQAVAFAFPSNWHHGSIVGGYGNALSRRSEGIGLPLFGITLGRDSGVYLFEPGGWRQLQ